MRRQFVRGNGRGTSRRLLRYLTAILVVAAAGATAWMAFDYRRLVNESGLTAEYRAGAAWDGAPDATLIENWFSAALVRQRSRERHGSAFTATWYGYLIVPARDRYRFSVLADDRAAIEIDKRPLIEGDRIRREASIELGRGLHPVTIRYYDGSGLQDLDIRWAQNYGPHDRIPRILLVPHLISGKEAQRRVRVWRWTSRLPVLWSATIIGGIAALLIYRCTRTAGAGGRETTQMLMIYVAAAALFIVGICWGLPDYRGWAVDEITPGEVQDILEHRFANGWATIYPPLHFALLALASSTVYTADFTRLADDTVDRYSQLFLIGRVLSVGMALAVVAFIYQLTRSELGHRAARFAVISALLVLPLAYYAKTANLDVPYLFWVAASWLFYMRAIRIASVKNACLFAATGAAAIATKDQSYGFYVLPAVHLIVEALRRKLDKGGLRTVFAMAVVFAGAILIFFNVPFNLSGVREHLRLIVGPASNPFRMYHATPNGYADLARDSVWLIGTSMSWPMFVFAMLGVVDAVRTKTLLINRLLLFSLSYYLTFIVVVMYQYDRFFIGICLVLAIAAGAWLDRWTRVGQPYRRWRLATAGLAIVYGAARVISLDAMMLRDSRYDVERWIIDRIGPDTRVAAEGASIYLPRQSTLLWSRIAADAEELRTKQPSFVIVNPAHSERSSEDRAASNFFAFLANGNDLYRRALTYRSRVGFSPLNWERRFDGRSEDPFSNLTKVNPIIQVYERIVVPTDR